MANMLLCEIVTPDTKLFSGEARLVSAPAAAGGIGFMYRCAPLMSTLCRGTIRIKDEKDAAVTFAVDGGYLEVDGYKVMVLATHAIELEKVSRDIAEKKIAEYEKRITEMSEEDPAKAFAEAEISWQNYLIGLL